MAGWYTPPEFLAGLSPQYTSRFRANPQSWEWTIIINILLLLIYWWNSDSGKKLIFPVFPTPLAEMMVHIRQLLFFSLTKSSEVTFEHFCVSGCWSSRDRKSPNRVFPQLLLVALKFGNKENKTFHFFSKEEFTSMNILWATFCYNVFLKFICDKAYIVYIVNYVGKIDLKSSV